ncbi:MAG: hypothetical protein ACR2G5_04310 [Pyrinomonadaceae bacterium]
MKRCPACKRVEADDTLVFCRADGTALISDSGSVSAEAGTVRFGSGPVSSEIETSVLPQTSTTPEINRSTGPTTVLPASQTPGTTRELSKPKRRAFVFVPIALVIVGVVIAAYFYFSRIHKTAIDSIAVMPFVNEAAVPMLSIFRTE